MRLWKKVSLGIALFLLVVVAVSAWGLNWFMEGACRNEVLAEIVSPDNQFKAVSFQRDCGATTGFSTQVSVIHVSEPSPTGTGNLFIADTNHGAAPSGPGGGPSVELAWSGNTLLTVSHHKLARSFKTAKQVGNISVNYEQFE